MSTRATQTMETTAASASGSPRICVREASLEDSLPPTPTPQPREIPPLPPRDRDTPPPVLPPALPPRDRNPTTPPPAPPPPPREVPPLPPRDRDTPPPPPVRSIGEASSDSGSVTTQLTEFYEEQAQLYEKLTSAGEVQCDLFWADTPLNISSPLDAQCKQFHRWPLL